MNQKRSFFSIALSLTGAGIVWTLLVVLVMHQFCHEVNLRGAIRKQEYAETAIQYAEQAQRQGDERRAAQYQAAAHDFYAEMYEMFSHSRRLYPFEMETLYIWGRYCIDNNNPQKGIEVLLDDLYQNPNYKWGHNNLGVCYDRQNDPMARESYRRALMVDPNQIYAHFNLGIGYLKEGKFAKAIPEFQATIASDPKKQEAYKYLAYSYEELGEHEKAIETMEKYSEVIGGSSKNNDSTSVAKLTALYKQQLQSAMRNDDVTAEVKYLEKLIELDPTANDMRQALIRRLQDLEDDERLVHHIQEMTKYNPKDPYAWYNLALVEAAKGREESLVENLKKALSLGSEEMRARARQDSSFARYRDNEELSRLLSEE